MRTQEEILERINTSTSMFGWDVEVLAMYLGFDAAESIRRPEITREAWENDQHSQERENVLEDFADYMQFAIGKAIDHRGISASRSIEKLQTWQWLLGDEPHPDEPYRNYGAPILKAVCEQYGFPVPDDERFLRMADGERCRDDCMEGCS